MEAGSSSGAPARGGHCVDGIPLNASFLESAARGVDIQDDCVRAMGGRIDVRSVEGDGTVFVLMLPKTPCSIEGSLAARLGASGTSAGQTRRPRIFHGRIRRL